MEMARAMRARTPLKVLLEDDEGSAALVGEGALAKRSTTKNYSCTYYTIVLLHYHSVCVRVCVCPWLPRKFSLLGPMVCLKLLGPQGRLCSLPRTAHSLTRSLRPPLVPLTRSARPPFTRPPSSLAPPPAGPSASHTVWSFNVGACSGDGGAAAEQAHVEAWLASTHPGEGWSYERLWRSDDGTTHAQCRREVAAAAAVTAQAQAVTDVAVPEEVPTLQLRRRCKELGLDRDGSRVALLARLEEAGAPVVAEGKVSPGVTAGGATDETATVASVSTPTELAPEATVLVEVALARAGDNAQELRAALEGAPTPAQRESVGKITAPMALDLHHPAATTSHSISTPPRGAAATALIRSLAAASVSPFSLVPRADPSAWSQTRLHTRSAPSFTPPLIPSLTIFLQPSAPSPLVRRAAPSSLAPFVPASTSPSAYPLYAYPLHAYPQPSS